MSRSSNLHISATWDDGMSRPGRGNCFGTPGPTRNAGAKKWLLTRKAPAASGRATSERRQASLIGDEEAFDLHIVATGASHAGRPPGFQHGGVATRRHKPNELGQVRSAISGAGATAQLHPIGVRHAAVIRPATAGQVTALDRQRRHLRERRTGCCRVDVGVHDASEVEIIGEDLCRSLNIQFRSAGFYRSEPYPYQSSETPALSRRLVFRALAEQMITSEDAERFFPGTSPQVGANRELRSSVAPKYSTLHRCELSSRSRLGKQTSRTDSTSS